MKISDPFLIFVDSLPFKHCFLSLPCSCSLSADNVEIVMPNFESERVLLSLGFSLLMLYVL